MDYAKETRNAYRNEAKARQYHDQYTRGMQWARFTMWRQRRLIKKIIDECELTAEHRILDIPCGTGFIGQILCRSSALVCASDISLEMMTHARGEYGGKTFLGLVQADVTRTPFACGSFDCVVLLAFMHRLPEEVRLRTWEEIVRLSRRFIVVNYSVDSRLQALKRRLLRMVRPNHVPAPSSLRLSDIIREIESQGLIISKMSYVAPWLSAKAIFVAVKGSSV